MFLTLWATPRSTSTAFEWMMRQRGDFECRHEPWNELYYFGVDRVSDRDANVEARPGHTYESTWSELETIGRHSQLFVKDFVYSAEHTLSDARLGRMVNTFLIRDPERVVQGLARHWPDCTWDEVGFASLHRLFHRVAERDGSPPVVMRSSDLLDDPEGTARAYCDAVGIPFVADALDWEPGDRAEVSWYDGQAGTWHDNLRASTGIQRQQTEYPPLTDSPRLLEFYERARPLYEDLERYALVPRGGSQPGDDPNGSGVDCVGCTDGSSGVEPSAGSPT